jgi:hypothetical protein
MISRYTSRSGATQERLLLPCPAGKSLAWGHPKKRDKKSERIFCFAHLQLHQCTRHNWTASTYSNIHWPAYYRSFKKRKLTSQLRIQKFSNGWLPVGRIRHRINPDDPDSCPSCLGRNETCDHVMRCREHHRAVLHSSQIDDLEDHLVKTKTPRPMATAIVQGITGWYRDPIYQIPLPRYNPVRPNIVLRKALTDQNAICWGRMYSGQISQDFQTVHNVDRPRAATTATPTLLASPTGLPS